MDKCNLSYNLEMILSVCPSTLGHKRRVVLIENAQCKLDFDTISSHGSYVDRGYHCNSQEKRIIFFLTCYFLILFLYSYINFFF